MLACRGGQQYGCRAVDSGGAGAGGSCGDGRFIGHRGTFCQDFTDYLLMVLLVVGSNGAAAATATARVTAGAGAGWVAIWDFLATAGIDYIHDPVGRLQGSDRIFRRTIVRSDLSVSSSRKICAMGEQAKRD